MALSISKIHYHLNLFLNASFLFLLFSTFLAAHNSDLPITHLKGHNNSITQPSPSRFLENSEGCRGLQRYQGDAAAKCTYAKSHGRCESLGYIPYIQLFYCTNPALGYTMFILWLILLFYLLGTTAAQYFCSSLEGISRILSLSPAVAGVTLLSLGNGAPDLFSSIVSFVGDGETDQVGLNSILGGAFFVSSIVVGLISVCAEGKVDWPSFRRDVLFLLISLTSLLVITILGEINLWGAISFLSLYFVYVTLVSTGYLCSRHEGGAAFSPPLELPANKSYKWNEAQGIWDELEVPLLGVVDDEKLILIESGNVHQFGDHEARKKLLIISKTCLFLLELPLNLPRRLTIPAVSEAQWSKPFAVLSVIISPVLLAFLLTSYLPKSSNSMSYTIGGSIGVVFGILAFLTTESSHPPRKCLFPWVVGGFVMSITWTYILARELVSLLVSLGLISGITSSVLGLTVLAWGNSLGDLVANVSMATNGGPEGTQVAISGCYAGPLFNILVGLGLSFVISSWAVYPAHYVLPRDPHIFETMGFLAGGLVFGLVVLSKKNMRLDRYLGGGLLAMYLCFLFLRIARASGLLLS